MSVLDIVQPHLRKKLANASLVAEAKLKSKTPVLLDLISKCMGYRVPSLRFKMFRTLGLGFG